MEKFCGLNVKQLWTLENLNIELEELQYWILYQKCDAAGKSVRVQASKGNVYKISHVVPGSLHYILFREGKGYLMENLNEEEENGQVDVEKLLLKKGIASELGKKEEVLEMKPMQICLPKEPSKDEVCQITVNENGFFVRHPTFSKKVAINGLWMEDNFVSVQVYYKPNTKRLKDRTIDKISSYMRVTEKNADYEDVFAEMLEKEQLDKEQSLKLYDKLEEYSLRYMIDGGDTFLVKESGQDSRVFYKDSFKKIKGKTARDMFTSWINEKWEGTINKAKILEKME